MRSLTVAAIAASALLCLGASSPNAAPITPIGKALSSATSNVETVQFRSCRRWYRECRIRWGWGPRFRRCMIRRGC